MILCICRVVRDADVDRAVAAGACTLDDVVVETGACTGCGKCAEAVEARLKRALAQQELAARTTGTS